MRIIIDLQGAQTESRSLGIGHYTINFAKALLKNSDKHDVLIVLNGLLEDTIEPIKKELNGLINPSHFYTWHAPGPINYVEASPDNRYNAMLIREAFIDSLNPDIVLISSLFEGYYCNAVTSIGLLNPSIPVVVINYDLLPLTKPKSYLNNDSYTAFYNEKLAYLKQASMICMNNEYYKQEFIQSNFSSAHVVSIRGGVDPKFHGKDPFLDTEAQLRQDYGITKPFLLCDGGGDSSRKSLNGILEAYNQIVPTIREQYQLVFVGEMPTRTVRQIKKIFKPLFKRKEVLFLGSMNDTALKRLYSMCYLYICPSWQDGLGFSILESMASGAPVICPNHAALPEIVGTDGALFDPLDIKDIAAKIEQCLTNKVFVSNLKFSEAIQVEKFSWEKSANLFLDALPLIQKEHRAIGSSDIDVNKFISLLNLSRHSNKDVYLTQLAYCLNLNHSAAYGYGKRRLFCDISHLVKFDHKTGIQRVVREILLRWLRDSSLPIQVIPVYLEFEKSICICKEAGLSGTLFFPTNNVIQPAKDDIFLGLDFNGEISKSIDSGIFRCWRNIGVSIHFIVYDILPIFHPEWWGSKGAGRNHARWLHSINKCSDTLIAISESVKQEVLHWLDSQNQDVTNIKWFHLGADISTHQDVSSKRLNDSLPFDFKNINFAQAFLMVSTIEPRKGYDQALSAFEHLWSNNHDYHLVIVGKQGWLTENIIEKIKTHPELNRKLFWFEGLDDDGLNLLYQKCCCLIAASYGEGFGLPLIEAAQKQLPIIARDIPVFREIAQSHAFYFNASEPEELANAIYTWFNLYKHDQHPKSTDMTFLTWNQSASQLLEIILSISDTWDHPYSYQLKKGEKSYIIC